MDRRDCLKAAGIAALSAAVGCAKEWKQVTDPRREAPSAPQTVGDAEIHLLQRAAFGPSPPDLARLREIGRTAWITEQLQSASEDDETMSLKLRLRRLDAFVESAYELRDWGEREILLQLQQATILRATYSRWQLRERMVDFWANHFNIYGRKVFTASRRPAASELTFFLGRDENEVIRAHALGNFKEMVRASMHSPAMLGYLDNQVNRQGVPNENYARELMELHTLGIGGGYTQKDVQEVARCLTGWTIEDRFGHKVGSFRFDPTLHDDGPKRVLGTTIPAHGGESDGDRVLDLLTAHPSTARFLAQKLVRSFYGEGPDAAALQERVAAAYFTAGDNIAAMMKALLTAPEFEHAAPPILKRPFDFLASALRATHALTDGAAAVQEHLAKMGQPLHQWPMPDGYPDRTIAWTGSLLARWNFALALATGDVGGTRIDPLPETADSLLESIFARPASHATLADLRATLAQFDGPPTERLALALASPAFQWR